MDTQLVIKREINDSARKVYMVTGYNIEDIKRKTRLFPIVQARMLLVHDLRKKQLTFKQIGQAINRHHASVMYLLAAYQDEYDTNPLFRKMAEGME